MRTITRRAFGLGGAASLSTLRARAQAPWPSRAVRLVIPFAPGGAADSLARILSEKFQMATGGQPLVIENKAGAGGTVAAADVARSAADGYSLLLGDIGANAVAPALFRKLPYDVETSFIPIIHLANLPMVMITHPSIGDGTVKGFIAAAKAKPGTLNYASAGPGGASHLMMEMFIKQAGLQIVHVAYRGGATLMQATMTNEVQVAISTLSTAQSFIEAGSVRAIGVGGLTVVPAFPDLRPIAETLPGYEALTWHGIHAPAGTAPDIITEINRVFSELLSDAAVKRKMALQTAEPIGGSSERYAQFVRSETIKWGEVVREAGIKMN